MDSWAPVAVPDLPGSGPQPMIWDTASGALALAAPGDTATLYACGITPYDATHIGHAATFLAWDLLVRAWRDAGKLVTYVQNVTDVDDPLLERANRDGEDWRSLAAREIALYRSDMTALRVQGYLARGERDSPVPVGHDGPARAASRPVHRGGRGHSADRGVQPAAGG